MADGLVPPSMIHVLIRVAEDWSATLSLGRFELQLAVHAGKQRGDGRAHRLVAHEHHYRDCGEDKRVFGHRLSALILTHLHKHSRDFVHCPESSWFFIGRNWPLSP